MLAATTGRVRVGRTGKPIFGLAGVFALLTVLLTGCDSTRVMLSGTVSAAPTGTGVGDVRVAVYADDAETLVTETRTDSDGRHVFRSSSLTAGSYRVRIGDRWWPDAPSWSTAGTVVVDDSSPAIIDAAFDEVGSLSGVAVDDRGDAVAGSLVLVVPDGGDKVVGRAVTGADGSYRVPVISAGSYRVALTGPDGKGSLVMVGGPTPKVFTLTTGETSVGTIAVSTGLPYRSTSRVSVSSAGEESHSDSDRATTSADGRYIAFDSAEANLVPGDINGFSDVFVHDRTTGVTSRVSVSTEGYQGDHDSYFGSISADGRYVAFTSRSRSLSPYDGNDLVDVFVHDRTTATTTRVSAAWNGFDSNGDSTRPSLSADGRYVVFQSVAYNLIPSGPGSHNGAVTDVFVHDRTTGTTSMVSTANGGNEGNSGSSWPSISADGRYVTFSSLASNLVANDTNNAADVFVRDRSTGVTTRVSTATNGTQANGSSNEPSISADGRYVAFGSLASNLVAGDTNGTRDVFVRDRTGGVTTRVSVASNGSEANGESRTASISTDGRSVAFESFASNLVAGDTNGAWDVFVRDRTSGVTTRVSVASNGSEANGESRTASISADGRLVAFTSLASNLVAGDTNYRSDVFVHDLSTR